MAVKTTVSVGVPRQQVRRRQVRYFALAWTGITLLVGACTFAVVYAATGIAGRATTARIDPPGITTPLGQLVAQITSTPLPAIPTITPRPITPTGVQAPAQPATQAAPPPSPVAATPTTIAVRDVDFDLGIAVQKNVDPKVYEIWMNSVKELKLNWVKSQVSWFDVEKTKGQFDWAEMDNALNQLYAANIKVLLSVTKAPNWARDRGAKMNPGVNDGPPANPQDFANFLAAMLNRYKGKVHAVEVWNEINIDREWTTNPPEISARRYVELLKVAQAAIKTIDPNIVVITSALSPTGANISGQVTDDFVYMDQLIQAGALQYADCVGTHHNGLNVPPTADWRNIPERQPAAKYRGPWENPHHSWSFKSTLEGYAQRIRNAGSALKLCITEFGWPSIEDLKGRGQLRDGFGFAADNTLKDQAEFTAQAITQMQQSGYVRLVFLWNLNYGAQADWKLGGAVGDNVPWSILGPNWSKRPVWQKIVEFDFRGRARKQQ